MRTRSHSLLASVVLLNAILTTGLLQSNVSFADAPADAEFSRNWAHWRGPTGNGTSLTAKPPTEWSTSKNIQWKTRIEGRGSGSPVVWEDKVFITTAVPIGRSQSRSQKLAFKVLCISRETGKTIWQQTATSAVPHEGTHSTNGFASASPCTDGQHVYASFGSRGLFCYSLEGQLKWKRQNFAPMRTRASFGEGSSPTLVNNLLILPYDHEGQSFLYAIDKTTGKDVWRTARDEPTCWATPLIVEHAGKQQVVMNGQNYARSYDLDTGKELWRCSGQTQRPVASPVATNGKVFVGSGFRGAFLGAFALDGQGDIQRSNQVAWTIERDTPDITSLLLTDSGLFFCKGKTGIVSCVDPETGKPHFSTQRLPNLGNQLYSSPIAAGGHIYFSDRRGTTVVIRDRPSLDVVAINSLGETIDATPAAVGNQLIMRGENHLFCIATPGK